MRNLERRKFGARTKEGRQPTARDGRKSTATCLVKALDLRQFYTTFDVQYARRRDGVESQESRNKQE
jgi:hypothetical protein